MQALLAGLDRFKDRYIYVVLVCVAVLGVWVAPDYGMGWDEPTSDHAGKVTLAFLENREDPNNPLSEDFMHFYGVVFELPLAFMVDKLHLSSHDTFVFRHTVTFLFFLVGVYYFYLLCKRRFPNSWLPLLGTVFLLVSPTIFGHAFFNSKDIPALVFFVIAFYTLLRLLDNPTIINTALHALTSALLIDTRLPGLFIVIVTVGFVLGNVIFIDEYRTRWKRMCGVLALYAFLVPILVLAFWPFLWADPIHNFLAALADMSYFSRQANLHLLYQGKIYIASEIPWHYIPVWIAITTPLVYLLLFLGGVGVTIMRFFRTFFEDNSLPMYYRTWRSDLVVAAWFFGPLLSVIALHSIMYDGWRQMYFVYPALIYFALVGIEAWFLFSRTAVQSYRTFLRYGCLIMVAGAILSVSAFMVRSHPNQHVYFNELVGGVSGALRTYDVDYWGVTFREGLEYIASLDTSDVIPVLIAGGTQDNLLILPPKLQKRFRMASTEQDLSGVKYILSNYRWQNYDDMPWEMEVYATEVDGAKIMTIFRNF